MDEKWRWRKRLRAERETGLFVLLWKGVCVPCNWNYIEFIYTYSSLSERGWRTLPSSKLQLSQLIVRHKNLTETLKYTIHILCEKREEKWEGSWYPCCDFLSSLLTFFLPFALSSSKIKSLSLPLDVTIPGWTLISILIQTYSKYSWNQAYVLKSRGTRGRDEEEKEVNNPSAPHLHSPPPLIPLPSFLIFRSRFLFYFLPLSLSFHNHQDLIFIIEIIIIIIIIMLQVSVLAQWFIWCKDKSFHSSLPVMITPRLSFHNLF